MFKKNLTGVDTFWIYIVYWNYTFWNIQAFSRRIFAGGLGGE